MLVRSASASGEVSKNITCLPKMQPWSSERKAFHGSPLKCSSRGVSLNRVHVLLPRFYFLTLFGKVPSNFRGNLPIRHLVDCFNPYDASAKVDSFKPFFQFALCLARTEDQNGFRITNACDDRIVVDVEMSCKGFLSTIICRYLLWFIGTPMARTLRTTGLFLNRRDHQSYLLSFVSDSYYNRLPVINP